MTAESKNFGGTLIQKEISISTWERGSDLFKAWELSAGCESLYHRISDLLHKILNSVSWVFGHSSIINLKSQVRHVTCVGEGEKTQKTRTLTSKPITEIYDDGRKLALPLQGSSKPMKILWLHCWRQMALSQSGFFGCAPTSHIEQDLNLIHFTISELMMVHCGHIWQTLSSVWCCSDFKSATKAPVFPWFPYPDFPLCNCILYMGLMHHMDSKVCLAAKCINVSNVCQVSVIQDSEINCYYTSCLRMKDLLCQCRLLI